MKFVRLVFAVMCFSIPISLFAQQGERRLASETYGTSSLTYVSLSPWDFHGYDSTDTYVHINSPANGIGRSSSSGTGTFEAALRLPEGAIVSYLEMYSCNYTFGPITSAFRALKTTDTTFSTIPGPSGPVAPACGATSLTISPIVIDNTTTSYTVEVYFPVTNALVLSSYRVGYKLQVSPAPGTATFSDVPTTHPFFQYVEALVSAGVTAGCAASPPQYCPDAPLTRGQMAVFLSRALGLHWAP